MKNNNYTEADANKLMTTYEDDFQEFLSNNWSPAGAATAMMQGY